MPKRYLKAKFDLAYVADQSYPLSQAFLIAWLGVCPIRTSAEKEDGGVSKLWRKGPIWMCTLKISYLQ